MRWSKAPVFSAPLLQEVDGEMMNNQTVGRMCAKIAAVLRGKNKAYYTPHVDCGDYIIVINADFVGINNNDVISAINMWRIIGLVLTTKNSSYFGAHASNGFIISP